MRRTLTTLVFVFVLGALYAIKAPMASAQSPFCRLSVDVFWTDTNLKERTVRGARAVAVRSGSEKRIPAFMVLGKPRFSRLPNGQYELTITKPGYKRTIQDVEFVCAKSSSVAKVRVELQPGAATESVVAGTQLIAAGARTGVTTIIGDSTGCSPLPPPPLGIAVPNMPIHGGVLNGKALSLPKPDYPAMARSARASGTVAVQVVIDEEGNVISAHAVSGHPLLRAVSVAAARGARFSPTRLSGQAVKVTGIITYNFVAK